MTTKMTDAEWEQERAAQDQEWARKINHLGVDGRLAKAREDLAGYAVFPGAELLDGYEQAKGALASYERLLREAVERDDPQAFVAQARFSQQKAQVEVLRSMIIERCDR